VNKANALGVGSAVVLMPGPNFTPTATVELEGIEVGGEEGQPRPTVIAPSGEAAFVLLSNPSALHDVNLVGDGGHAVVYASGTLERIDAEVTAGFEAACSLRNVTVVDSVCYSREGTGAQMSSTGVTFHSYLHNVTAVGGNYGIEVYDPLISGDENRLEATNTIARGFKVDDVEAEASKGGAQALFTNSDYATTVQTGSSTNLRITPAGTNGGVVAPPQFVDPAGADFHQLASSPTIDAGFEEPGDGPFDLDRNPRRLTAHPTCTSTIGPADIGAYEYVAPVPTCVPPPPPLNPPPAPPKPAAPGTSLTKAKIDGAAGAATFTFAGSGVVGGFECELVRPALKGAKAKAKRPQPKFAACTSPKTYRHLVPGRYTFKVEATGPGGTGRAAKRAFAIRPPR
jgi:hypothetical protein